MLYPVEVLGPGKRIGIWFSGCQRRCEGCVSPELWEREERFSVTAERLFSLIRRVAEKHPVDGFTLTGGDPLDQADELRKLIPMLHVVSQDILCYTGLLKSEIPEDLLSGISVLIDGPYMEERNTGSILRGSDNQVIHILDEKVRGCYETYCAARTNEIQNFTSSEGIISVGIHRPGRTAQTRRRKSNG